MSTIMGTTDRTFRVTLTVDGVDWGVWDKKTGGKVSAGNIVFPPGGEGDPYALGGAQTVDPITLSRNYRLQRDHDNANKLLHRTGKARCVVKQVPLDSDGNAYGQPATWTGLLASVEIPDHDSTGSNPAMLTLEITSDGTPTVGT